MLLFWSKSNKSCESGDVNKAGRWVYFFRNCITHYFAYHNIRCLIRFAQISRGADQKPAECWLLVLVAVERLFIAPCRALRHPGRAKCIANFAPPNQTKYLEDPDFRVHFLVPFLTRPTYDTVRRDSLYQRPQVSRFCHLQAQFPPILLLIKSTW